MMFTSSEHEPWPESYQNATYGDYHSKPYEEYGEDGRIAKRRRLNVDSPASSINDCLSTVKEPGPTSKYELSNNFITELPEITCYSNAEHASDQYNDTSCVSDPMDWSVCAVQGSRTSDQSSLRPTLNFDHGNSHRPSSRSSFFSVVLEGGEDDRATRSTYCSPGQPLIDTTEEPSLVVGGDRDPSPLQEQDERDDVCFGVVIIDLRSPPRDTSGHDNIPVNLQTLGDTLTIHHKDTNKYLGLLVNPAISRLLTKRGIVLDTKIVKQPAEEVEKGSGGKHINKSRRTAQLNTVPTYAVKILVSGSASKSDTVCNLLSDAGLYLQQPRSDEIDRVVTYHNPHYMVRPGSKMPDLSMGVEPCSKEGDEGSVRLLEVQKNQLMRIFDAASGVEGLSEIRPSARLLRKLQEHQELSLAFMMEKENGFIEVPKFPTVWQFNGKTNKYRHVVTGMSVPIPRPVSGGILADEMGLGKTLAVLALICSSLDIKDHNPTLDTCHTNLVVAPKSTIPNWQSQIQRHIKSGTLRAQVYHGNDRHLDPKALKNVDLVITTYETLRSEWNKKGMLMDTRWHRIILDEAHHIRNRSSQVFQAACALRSSYRWCLTGTPIHNCLDDYGSLLSFIGIEPFVEKAPFDRWITKPLREDRKGSLEKLRALVKATCLRRTKASVKTSCELPPRADKIVTVDLSPLDRELYNYFNDKATRTVTGMSQSDNLSGNMQPQNKINILALINNLRLICNHGPHLLPMAAVEEWRRHDNATFWQNSSRSLTGCYSCGGSIDEFEPVGKSWINTDPKDMLCSICAAHDGDDDLIEGPDAGNSSLLSQAKAAENRVSSVSPATAPSAKIDALLQNLSAINVSEMGAKSVIFSYWTKMLDVIQSTLDDKGFRLQRIDGGTSLEARAKAMHQFQNDPGCTIMLASIGSAGEGVDLTAANHVHLMEPHWNPMIEAQAVDRVHRIGQIRPVTTTRYIVRDSIENYVQWLQQDKIKLVNRSIDASDLTQAEVDEQRLEKLRAVLKRETPT